jgi:hypothetical protein
MTFSYPGSASFRSSRCGEIPGESLYKLDPGSYKIGIGKETKKLIPRAVYA